MTNHKRNKTIKIIAITVGAILLVVGIAGIWLTTHYKGIIRQNLPGWVADASDGLYKISYDDISINLLTKKVMLTNARMWPDSSRLDYLQQTGRGPETVFDMDIPKVTVSGVDLGALVGTKNLGCDLLYMNDPKIIITALARDTVDTADKNGKPTIEKVGSDRIEIHGANIVYKNHTSADSSTYYISGGDIAFTDWYFEPGKAKGTDTSKIYGKLGNLDIDSFNYTTSTGFYTVQCGHISIQGNQTTLNEFRLNTPYSKKDFYKKAGKQKEIYNIHFPFVRLHDFEPEKLLNNNLLEASLIELKKAYIDIYFSRVAPPNNQSKVGNYPNQMIQKFDVKTYIKKVEVQSGKFRYTEKNDKTMREGSFFIQDINGDVSHVSNMAEHLQAEKNCTIKLKGSFMGKSSMAATFKLDLTDTLGGFSVTGEHRNLDAGEIREMVQALAVVDIKSMHASSIKFSVNGNQNSADGSLTMLYNKLDIQLMKVADDKELKNQGLLSFIAKKTLIHEANPTEGKDVRSVSVHQERRPTASFFNLIWKTLFAGITETALKTDGAADYVQDAKPGKKNKKGIIKTIRQVFKNDKKESKKEDK